MEIDKERMFEIHRRNLRIILVLSIIGSGMYALAYLMWGLMLPTIQGQYASGALQLPDEMTVAYEDMIYTPRSFYLCGTLLYVMSLVGVILMWNLRKSGFHLYTLAQLLVLVITVLFLGKEHLAIGNVMLTLLFVTYYFIALRRLGVFSKESSGNDKADGAQNEE